tara:strand:- start:1224 stop:1571 length:348 start_codon:yes stop_codon:yes gene_type:complete
MGFSYSSYFGPAIIVKGMGRGYFDTEEIDERLYEGRGEFTDSQGRRFLLPNRGGYAFDVTPRDDCEKEPEVIQPDDIQNKLDRFKADFANDIEWVRKQYPDATLEVQFVLLMDAM